MTPRTAVSILAHGMAMREPSERAAFLADMLTQVVAGLLVIQGPRDTINALYDVADAVIMRKETQQ